jgi:hypothetical protein
MDVGNAALGSCHPSPGYLLPFLPLNKSLLINLYKLVANKHQVSFIATYW